MRLIKPLATLCRGRVVSVSEGPSRRNHAVRSFAFATVAVAGLAAAVLGSSVKAQPPWGPETPPFNLEVILRDVTGGNGFGHVTFRQPNDDTRIIFLNTWVRDLEPNHDYLLQRAVDTVLDGNCTGTAWLTLGEGLVVTPIATDDQGTGRAALFRDLDPPGPATGPPPGTSFDIHFRMIDAVTLAPVLQSDCYRFTVSL